MPTDGEAPEGLGGWQSMELELHSVLCVFYQSGWSDGFRRHLGMFL